MTRIRISGAHVVTVDIVTESGDQEFAVHEANTVKRLFCDEITDLIQLNNPLNVDFMGCRTVNSIVCAFHLEAGK